jgi:hypothetical protein
MDIAGAISANGSGVVLLNSTGADTDILVSGAISSGSGNVTLNATGNIALDQTVSTTGTVTLTADSEVGGTGAITYASGSVNATGVIVTAAEGITLSTDPYRDKHRQRSDHRDGGRRHRAEPLG